MSDRKKQITAGVLGIGVLAVWGPQLYARLAPEDARPTTVERAALDEPAVPGLAPEGVAIAAGGASPSGASAAFPAARPASPGRADVDPVAAAEGALSSMEAFLPTGARDGALERLVASWSSGDTAASGQPEPLPTESPLAAETGLGGHHELQAFLSANPLGGIIHGERSAVATFGPLVVRAGDELLEGALRVERIEPRRVHLSHRGRPVVVDLPPFRAAPGSGSAASATAASEAAELEVLPE